MKTRNILHLTSWLCGLSILCVLCASCEDYTEHNFGKPEELWQATQVNNYDTITLSDENYRDIATAPENIALAKAADDNGETLAQLEKVAVERCFFGNITPQDYLPAILKNIVGPSGYYSMTAGSNIPIKFRQGEIVSSDAYVLKTGELNASGKYLLVPIGQEQVLAGSNNMATGQTYTYGYIYLSGSTRYPDAVTRVDGQTIKADETTENYLYNIEKNGDTWLLSDAIGQYLYMDDEHNTFQYIEDLGDIEDGMHPDWHIAYNEADQTYDIVNTETQKVVLFGTSFGSAGAYADKKGEEGYLGIQIYERQASCIETVEINEELQELTFILDEEGWMTNADYMNQPLTGGTTLTNMDEVYKATGWSVEYKGSIGDLTYVWRYDATYGLRASAYKSSTYYPTDAWAISPRMNLKKAEKPILYFEQAQKYAEAPVTDYLQVFVSTNYTGRGGLELATWTDVTGMVQGTWPDGSDWTYYPMWVDLSTFVGEKNVCVAFRYISTDAVAATWEVKNVVCREEEN